MRIFAIAANRRPVCFPRCRYALSAVIAGGIALAVSSPCEAGPLWDALFGRRNNYYYPVGAYYVPVTSVPPTSVPVIAGYAPFVPTQSSAYDPLVVHRPFNGGSAWSGGVAPAGVWIPATGSAPAAIAPSSFPTAPITVYSSNMAYAGAWNAPAGAAAGPCATGICPAPQAAGPSIPAAVAYWPRTAYRTVWYRVPVTSFRPTTVVNPTTGCAATSLAPCTTYAWQARRVPAPSGGGFLSRLFHGYHASPQPVAAPCAVPSGQAFGGVCPAPTGSAGVAPTYPGYLVPPSSPSTIPGAPVMPSPCRRLVREAQRFGTRPIFLRASIRTGTRREVTRLRAARRRPRGHRRFGTIRRWKGAVGRMVPHRRRLRPHRRSRRMALFVGRAMTARPNRRRVRTPTRSSISSLFPIRVRFRTSKGRSSRLDC